MKAFSIAIWYIFLVNYVHSQSITPSQNNEYCPNTDYTFLITLSNTFQSVVGVDGCFVKQHSLQSGGGTLSVVVTFADQNIHQKIKVTYTSGVEEIITFNKIKSLFYGYCGSILPNPSVLNVPVCQTQQIPLSFTPVQWKTESFTSQSCFGSISEYEYQLPKDWVLNGVVSTGSNWISGDNNETLSSSLLSGGVIAIRPKNSCGQNTGNNVAPTYINVNRTNAPVLRLNGATSVDIRCGDGSAKTFSIDNSGSCISSYQWQVANKGWADATGNLITNNITTTTPSITLYPSCNTATKPQDVEVRMTAGTEQLSSAVTVTNSSQPPVLQIQGPSEFCNSGAYTIPLTCGASVTWSLEYLPNHTNVATLDCTTCPTVNVSRYNDGTALLRATVQWPNCTQTGVYEKYIGIGTPVIRGWYNSPTNPQEPLKGSTPKQILWNDACYTEFINTNMDITANSQVVWESAGNSGGVTWSQLGNNLRLYFSDIDQWAYFTASATNSCGTKSWVYRFRSVYEGCDGGILLRVAVAPNPATSTIQVELTEKSDPKKRKEIKEIKIIDRLGNVKQKATYSPSGIAQAITLSIAALPSDMYTLMVYDGSTWTSTQLLKE